MTSPDARRVVILRRRPRWWRVFLVVLAVVVVIDHLTDGYQSDGWLGVLSAFGGLFLLFALGQEFPDA